jgi:hypothetical protein
MPDRCDRPNNTGESSTPRANEGQWYTDADSAPTPTAQNLHLCATSELEFPDLRCTELATLLAQGERPVPSECPNQDHDWGCATGFSAALLRVAYSEQQSNQ